MHTYYATKLELQNIAILMMSTHVTHLHHHLLSCHDVALPTGNSLIAVGWNFQVDGRMARVRIYQHPFFVQMLCVFDSTCV